MQESNSKEKQTSRPKSTASGLLSTILYLAFVVLAAYLIVTFVGQRTVVSGSSMENTLDNGDNLIVDKISYRISEPKRFDVVVFPYPQDPSTYFIKRVIGLPGERVRIDEGGNIYINGRILEETFGRETIQNPGQAARELTLGDNQYFVLGDNRNNSMDSRDPRVGLIDGNTLMGRAFMRIWPLNKLGLVRHSN